MPDTLRGDRILIVEDEPAVARGLKYGLQEEGFDVTWAATGKEAIDLAHRANPALIILDIRLPDMSGFDVCRELRKDLRQPILMLTVKDEEVDKVLGLEMGADDYMTKPYSLRELTARVRALLRRTYGELASPPPQRLQVGNLVLDTSLQVVLAGEREEPLTATEYRLLFYLMQHPGQVLSRRQLLNAVWGYKEYLGDERTVDVHIRHLREKVESDPSHPRILMTVRGAGYKLHAS